MCRTDERPETAGRVLEDRGPLGIAGLRVLVGLVLPARVRDDDLVGHGLQAVVDDHHLQRFIGGQIPQGSCRKKREKGGLWIEIGRLKRSKDKGEMMEEIHRRHRREWMGLREMRRVMD